MAATQPAPRKPTRTDTFCDECGARPGWPHTSRCSRFTFEDDEQTPAEIANAILDGAERTKTDLCSALDISDETFEALVSLAALRARNATQPTHEWKNQHAAHCAVTSERADLLSMLEQDPTNAGLLGAVPEYDNGGDQEAENCDCGAYDRAQALLVLALDVKPCPECARDVRWDEDAHDWRHVTGPACSLALAAVPTVAVPFEGDQPLVIDPAAEGANYHGEMLWLHNNLSEDEAPRVFASAVVLYESDAGTFAECLRTAVIWERG